MPVIAPRQLPLAILVVLTTCLLAAAPTRANRPHRPERLAEGAEEKIRELPRILQVTGTASENSRWEADDPALRAFAKAAGGSWRGKLDLRSGRPAMISGSGVPWLPGAGNDLDWPALGFTEQPSETEILTLLEGRARALLATHPNLFRLPDGVAMRLNPRGSGSVLEGRVRFVTLDAFVDGVPVLDSYVTFRLNSGNLVQLGSIGVVDSLTGAVVEALVSPKRALEDALGALADAFTPAGQDPSLAKAPVVLSEVLDAGTLQLIPTALDPREWMGPVGEGLSHRLAWRVSFRLENGYETWVSFRDARTGEGLSLSDENRYDCPTPALPQGRVTGGVYLGAVEEVPESVRGMPWASVDNSGPFIADYEGLFPLEPAAPASTGLNGTWFDMDCIGCSSPAQVFVEATGSGDLFLGFDGADEIGNGRSTRSERNTYYALNVCRQLATKHLTNFEVNGFFNTPLAANVNIPATCNAFYDGNSVNFFRSGGGCNNSGDIHDVAHHEWGHGLDDNTDGGAMYDGARGEAIGDIVAFLSTHDPHNAPYFFVGQPFELDRTADEAIAGLKTFSNIAGLCPPGGGPAGAEIHCEAGVFSETVWHLMENLVAKYGELGGWFVTERLFFASLPITDTYASVMVGSSYDGFVLIDDDNGDLTDGTPNGTEILDAFQHHEIEGFIIRGDSLECPAPPAPALTLELLVNVDTELPQVRVTWPDQPTAVEYRLFRNDADAWGPDVPIATIFPPAVEYLDDNLTDGVTYSYRMMVFEAGGCFSTDDNVQQVSVVPTARLALASWATDDSGPFANGNGVPEPGETFGIPIEVTSLVSPATVITATLSTLHPLVTILQDTVAVGDLATGGLGPALDPQFEVLLDPAMDCAEPVSFTVTLDAAEGCSQAQFVVIAGLTGFNQIAVDDLEVDSGWRVNPDFLDDATTGAWVREDPIADRGSPEDDHTAGPGVTAWITGNMPAPGGGGADDVDDGCTTLESPIFAMGGQPGYLLSYWHFTTYRRINDPGDGLFVEISNNTVTWTPLEQIDTPSIGWEQSLFDLDTVLGEPADDLQLRFTACDAGAGSFLDALIDDIEVLEAFTTCLSPAPAPLLVVDTWLVGDSVADGGNGNANRGLDPGETVRLPFDLRNVGTGEAFNVSGTLTLVSAPMGVQLSDGATDWADIAPGAVERSGAEMPPHFELDLPRPGVDCGGDVMLSLHVDYEDAGGTPYTIDEDYPLPIGCEPAEGCESMPTPVDAGPVLRGLAGDEDGAELAWPTAAPTPGEHFRLYRGTRADVIDTLVTPPDHVLPGFDDRTAPDALYFYLLRLADCDGVEGP